MNVRIAITRTIMLDSGTSTSMYCESNRHTLPPPSPRPIAFVSGETIMSTHIPLQSPRVQQLSACNLSTTTKEWKLNRENVIGTRKYPETQQQHCTVLLLSQETNLFHLPVQTTATSPNNGCNTVTHCCVLYAVIAFCVVVVPWCKIYYQPRFTTINGKK